MIRSILNEYKHEGQYSIRLEDEYLDQGVYFCRISYGSNSETIKMVVTGR